MDLLVVGSSILMFVALVIGLWLGARKTKKEKEDEDAEIK